MRCLPPTASSVTTSLSQILHWESHFGGCSGGTHGDKNHSSLDLTPTVSRELFFSDHSSVLKKR